MTNEADWKALGELFKTKNREPKIKIPKPNKKETKKLEEKISTIQTLTEAHLYGDLKRLKRNTRKDDSLTPIFLPGKLIQDARQKLTQERGINLEEFLQIYLRMILRASKGILALNDNIPFGKYQGEKLEHVVRIDPSYIHWLINQDGRTKFEPEVLILVDEILKK